MFHSEVKASGPETWSCLDTHTSHAQAWKQSLCVWKAGRALRGLCAEGTGLGSLCWRSTLPLRHDSFCREHSLVLFPPDKASYTGNF